MAKRSPMESGTAPERKAKEEPEADPKLIETDHPENKLLIAAIRRAKKLDRASGDAQDAAYEQREKVKEIMHDLGFAFYKYRGFVAALTRSEKLTLKAEKKASEDTESESDD